MAPVTRRFTGAFSYLPVTLLAGAMVSVLVSFAVRVVEPAVHEALGIYLPLTCVNAMAVAFVAREGFSAQPASKSSLGTAAFAAVCAFATLTFVGFINGMLSTGEVFASTMPESLLSLVHLRQARRLAAGLGPGCHLCPVHLRRALQVRSC